MHGTVIHFFIMEVRGVNVNFLLYHALVKVHFIKSEWINVHLTTTAEATFPIADA